MNKEIEVCGFHNNIMELSYQKDGRCITDINEYCSRCQNSCTCRGNKASCDFYPDIRAIGISDIFSSSFTNDFLFWLRTHMTSISRYVNNKNSKKDKEYRQLALDAIDAILMMINGKSSGGES